MTQGAKGIEIAVHRIESPATQAPLRFPSCSTMPRRLPDDVLEHTIPLANPRRRYADHLPRDPNTYPTLLFAIRDLSSAETKENGLLPRFRIGQA